MMPATQCLLRSPRREAKNPVRAVAIFAAPRPQRPLRTRPCTPRRTRVEGSGAASATALWPRTLPGGRAPTLRGASHALPPCPAARAGARRLCVVPRRSTHRRLAHRAARVLQLQPRSETAGTCVSAWTTAPRRPPAGRFPTPPSAGGAAARGRAARAVLRRLCGAVCLSQCRRPRNRHPDVGGLATPTASAADSRRVGCGRHCCYWRYCCCAAAPLPRNHLFRSRVHARAGPGRTAERLATGGRSPTSGALLVPSPRRKLRCWPTPGGTCRARGRARHRRCA
mmetsp:Transcript_43121/g.119266  ORF Transcript_43121/g.119266 Transcript_43121/m.119266 type:complete len:283 (+) Transcript_43121:496-1344(+)